MKHEIGTSRPFLFLLVSICLSQTPYAAAQTRGAISAGEVVPRSAGSPLPASVRNPQDRWVPPDIDQFVPPVAPGVACKLPRVLAMAGKRVEQLVRNVNRFSATEVIEHHNVDGSGRLRRPQTLRFDYLVSIEPAAHGYMNFREYRNRGNNPDVFPDHVATVGVPSLALIFHPRYIKDFQMTCEGLGQWKGQPAWQVRFEQSPNHINHMSSLVIGGHAYGLRLRGRAWILTDSYQIARLETDLARTIPKIRLRLEHEDIEYRSVHFPGHHLDLWLPVSSDLYMDFSGHRFYRRQTFTDFQLFSVDVQENFNTFR